MILVNLGTIERQPNDKVMDFRSDKTKAIKQQSMKKRKPNSKVKRTGPKTKLRSSLNDSNSHLHLQEP